MDLPELAPVAHIMCTYNNNYYYKAKSAFTYEEMLNLLERLDTV